MFGERDFSYAGPRAWNHLPDELHEIYQTITNAATIKKHPKTHGLNSVFNYSYVFNYLFWLFLTCYGVILFGYRRTTRMMMMMMMTDTLFICFR